MVNTEYLIINGIVHNVFMKDGIKCMINDCHIHIGKSSMINQEITLNDLVKFRKYFPFTDKVLVFGTDLFPHNEFIKKVVHEYDWIYGLYWWENTNNKIELDNKLIGVKYHGAYLKHPVTSMNPRYLEKMDDLKAILMVHCGRYLEGDIKSNTSYLHALEVAHNYPHIKVILAHMGGTDTVVSMKAIEHGAHLSNVYFDTAGITTPYIIEYACAKLPIHRILFGSDKPWCSFNAMLWTVADAQIPQTYKDAIFQHNFERLLK